MRSLGRRQRVFLNPCSPSLTLGSPGILPKPDETTWLGRGLEIEHEMPDGTAARHEWSIKKAPHVFWRPRPELGRERGDLYVFTATKLPPMRKRPSRQLTSEAADAWRRWTGKEPDGETRLRVPRIHTRRAGLIRHLLYRSNKWGKTRSAYTNYVHPLGPGVVVDLGPGTPPSVFYIHGGDLRLTTHGLEG